MHLEKRYLEDYKKQFLPKAADQNEQTIQD